jgi:hypothetical protein
MPKISVNISVGEQISKYPLPTLGDAYGILIYCLLPAVSLLVAQRTI